MMMPDQRAPMPDIGFSILISSFNYADYVGAAVESCLRQDYPQDLVEIIVVDDGSTDASLEVLARFCNEPNVKVLSQSNQGQAAAIATALAHATQNYVCLLDSDDCFGQDKLKRLNRKLGSYGKLPEYFFLCHDLEILDGLRDKPLSQTWFESIGLRDHAECLSLGQIASPFPFSVPTGQVYSKALLDRVMDSLPLSDWKTFVDTPLAHAAMLLAGFVHYLHEPLGTYLIHARNDSALQVRDNVLQLPQKWRAQWPKLLQFLENFIDSLEFDAHQRNERLAYLKRMQRIVRVASRRQRHAEPCLSFFILPAQDPSALEATLISVANQSHENCEAIVAVDAQQPGRELIAKHSISHPHVRFRAIAPAASLHATLRSAYRASSGDYFSIVAAGDVLDGVFAERHLYAHRHLALSMVTSCDLRLMDSAHQLIHDNCYASSGAWNKWVEYLPMFSVALNQWAFSPRSANVFRRAPVFDLFFDDDDPAMVELDPACEWLLLYLAHAFGGSTRLNECLVSLRMTSDNDATYLHLASPLVNRFAPGGAPPAAAQFFFRLLGRNFAAFKRHYTPRGLKNFVEWLLKNNPPQLRSAFRADAARIGIAELMEP